MPEETEEMAKVNPGDITWFEPSKVLAPRVRGFLYVTEHNNYGDVQFDSPIEPAAKTSRIAIGSNGMRIKRESHIIVLFATYPCRVAFVPDGEDMADAETHAFPLAAETEVTRIVHMNAAMTIVAFPDY